MTTEVPPLSAEEIAIDSLRKACACLYLEVPARIADDVRSKANAVISLVESRESQLRDANRSASELFGELGATQNAAQAERVELESKLREVTRAAADHEECIGELEYAAENAELKMRLREAEETIEQMAGLAFDARAGANKAIYRVEEYAETYQRRAQPAQKESEPK